MTRESPALESRVEDLERRLGDLEGRFAAMERRLSQGDRPGATGSAGPRREMVEQAK